MKQLKRKKTSIIPEGMYLEKFFIVLLVIVLFLLVFIKTQSFARAPSIEPLDHNNYHQYHSQISKVIVYRFHVNRVIDGSTVEVKEYLYPPSLGRIRLRLRGVVVPRLGKNAECRSEIMMAQAAKNYLSLTLNPVEVLYIRNIGHISQDGIVEADIIIVTPSGQLDLSQLMLDSGLARPNITTRKYTWCP